jgi:hypothetical protein
MPLFPFEPPIPIRRLDREPVAWFVRLRRALAEGDPVLERTARLELRRLGWRVTVDRQWRKGGDR